MAPCLARPPLVVCLVLAAALLVPSPSLAQDVDCTGISEALDSDGSLDTVLLVTGLRRPIHMASPPGDTERQFILLQDGQILIMKNDALVDADSDGTPDPFLDISGIVRSPDDNGNNEEGLLGIAFHPAWDNDGTDDWFFLYHTSDGDGTVPQGDNVVARYSRDPVDPDLADASSRVVVKQIVHPFWGNHDGGSIAFGPNDGYLYFGTGDGGGSCDGFPTSGAAQSLSSDLGKIIRLDVDPLPATNPSSNPFFGGASSDDDDLWAYGLRNPWRIAFDRDPDFDGDGTTANRGDLYIADVGQDAWEEINYRTAASTGGENYAWNVYEGSVCPNPSCGGTPACGSVTPTNPVHEYVHNVSMCSGSITGGYVYRGCRMPDLRGTYFYADYCQDFIESLRVVGGSATAVTPRSAELDPNGDGTLAEIHEVTSFGEDEQGEIYIIDRGDLLGEGEIFKIVPPLMNLQVSGANAAPFTIGGSPLLGSSDDFAWEDLQAASSQEVSLYRVYRSNAPDGLFSPVLECAGTVWTGGDPDDPTAGAAFFYVVTAKAATGEESDAGRSSAGAARNVDSAASCTLPDCETCP